MRAISGKRCLVAVLITCLTVACGLFGQEICKVVPPTASLSIPYVKGSPALNTDPKSETWKAAASAWIVKDCTRTIDYQKLKTEVRAFWTDEHLYLLFICPYETLNIFLPPQNDKPRHGLWDRDVVEVFLGADWDNIGRYREYEVAPTGDWIDLDISYDVKTHDAKGNHDWRSGWNTAARINSEALIWYAAARIPLKSVTSQVVKPGTRWRANLYRIAGQGPDTERQFLCWQPTCAPGRDPNHVPENFGSLTFRGAMPEREIR